MTIAVLDYGSGNLHSVSRALAQVGGDPVVTGDARTVAASDALVIPGVGHFGACIQAIARAGLDSAIRDFRASGRPVFGVCVGMQVLYEGSDEGPEAGLGLLAGRVRRLPDDVKVPHMGWNSVSWSRPHPFIRDLPEDTRFYFVHSFAPDPGGDAVGITHHGRPFAAAVADENVFATQFHPEKSGDAGAALLRNWVTSL